MLKECKLCGQMVDTGESEREGYYYCNCGGAKAEVHTEEQIDEACINIDTLFGEDCEDFGFVPVKSEATVCALKILAGLIGRGKVGAATLKIPGAGVAVIASGSKGEIKVMRRVTQAQELKAQMNF